MSSGKRRIVEHIVAKLAGELKTEGFARKGLDWHRSLGEGVQVLTIYPGPSGVDGFNFELGLYFEALEELFASVRETPFQWRPSTPWCPIRMRVGDLIPAGPIPEILQVRTYKTTTFGGEFWWPAHSGARGEAAANHLVEVWQNYVRPVFEQCTTMRGARDWMLPNNYFADQAAGLSVLLGEPWVAEDALNRSLAHLATARPHNDFSWFFDVLAPRWGLKLIPPPPGE